MIQKRYRDAENKCQYVMWQCEIKRDRKVIERNNAGTFFHFVSGKLSCKRGFGELNNDKVTSILVTTIALTC